MLSNLGGRDKIYGRFSQIASVILWDSGICVIKWQSEFIMEIYPGLACIWTKGDPSGLSFFIEVHKLPSLYAHVCWWKFVCVLFL